MTPVVHMFYPQAVGNGYPWPGVYASSERPTLGLYK